jgi:hypothetical protein
VCIGDSVHVRPDMHTGLTCRPDMHTILEIVCMSGLR